MATLQLHRRMILRFNLRVSAHDLTGIANLADSLLIKRLLDIVEIRYDFLTSFLKLLLKLLLALVRSFPDQSLRLLLLKLDVALRWWWIFIHELVDQDHYIKISC